MPASRKGSGHLSFCIVRSMAVSAVLAVAGNDLSGADIVDQLLCRRADQLGAGQMRLAGQRADPLQPELVRVEADPVLVDIQKQFKLRGSLLGGHIFRRGKLGETAGAWAANPFKGAAAPRANQPFW